MSTTKTAELIQNVIGPGQLADYLTADHAEWLGVYANGKVCVGESVGDEIDPSERPIAMVRCPGIGQADREWWAEGVEDADEMDIEELIIHGCEDGDVDDLIKRLIEELIDSSTGM